jgi:hypothetical protein
MSNKITIIVSLAIILIFSNGQAQGFKAMAIVGSNLSQIDGDKLYGFKKIGLSAGARLSYTNVKNVDYSLEMMYSQRGSAVNFFNNGPEEKINLNYLEIPVVMSLRDWYQDKDGYYKVRADFGLSYGYLFGAEATGFDVSLLKKNDISWLVGVGINFNKMIGFSIRYSSSLMDMYNDAPDLVSYKSYFLTFRSEFNF